MRPTANKLRFPVSGTERSHSMRLSEFEIYGHFGDTIAERASADQKEGKVLSLAISKDFRTIYGTIESNAKTKCLKARIKLDNEGRKILDCRCSCDRGGLCKHSAALLFEATRTGMKQLQPSSNAHSAPKEALQDDNGFEIRIEPPRDNCEDTRQDRYAATASSKAKFSNNLVSIALLRDEEKDHPLRDEKKDRRDSQINSIAVAQISHTKPSALVIEALANPQNNGDYTADLQKVIYLLDQAPNGSRLCVEEILLLHQTSECEPWQISRPIDLAELRKNISLHRDKDALIASLMSSQVRNPSLRPPLDFPNNPHLTRLILEQMLETNRCFWQRLGETPLSLGKEEEAHLEWKVDIHGFQTLCANFAGQVLTMHGGGLWWYVDAENNIVGPAKFPISTTALFAIMNAPPLSPVDAEIVAQKLLDLGSPIPLPHKFEQEIVKTPPIPCLTLTAANPYELSSTSGNWWGQRAAVAQLNFDYGDGPAGANVNKQRFVNGKLQIRKRMTRFEGACMTRLVSAGLFRETSSWSRRSLFLFPQGQEDQWYHFVSTVLPQLEQEGWQIDFDPAFPYQIVEAEDDWDIETTEGADFWFSVRLDITVEGQKYPLLPIIKEAIKNIRGTDAVAEIAKLNTNGIFYAPFPDGRKVALDFERVKVIIETLVELFNKEYKFNTKVEVSLPQAILLLDQLRVRWHAPARVKELLQKFRDFKLKKNLKVPRTFKAVLRPYQAEALGWFDFIRELGLGGILADDMGLGKTVQTLAHFAIEKASGRKTKPYLVVCPKSVLPNWLAEIEKFAPEMKTVALHGPGRASNFAKISQADIVVTTYPLIVRDYAVLTEQAWQCVVLDEAQIIKNPESQAAQVARALKADYRICLTGTPVQNNLSELWSLFEFLLPGFLGGKKAFASNYRRPIERDKNLIVQQALAARIKPFLLRRMKEVVASELPEKVVITKLIELDGAQRDLYETVREAMSEKVKQALETKGLAKSQIIVLDALLKLRQVCCDPRLVSLPAARNINTSVKLDSLMDMLEELIAEGRKILLFSQFTSMLDLIVPEVEERRIRFVQLRGDTTDRQTPVHAFQTGNVPLFLISLKAGGLGLNLTAADTVIHYDPWWNPAVEDQATDRSHRIGQEQKVFVFKLLAANTIEERMLKLQDRKRGIAAKIYTDQADSPTDRLTEAEIKSLFAPI